ncbi:MAG TPA: cytochrome c-type biogenesis protein CcmH [Gemmatimonadales bacterium]
MSTMGRREFFLLAIGGVGAVVQDTTQARSQVYDPDRAGRSQTPVTAADNDKSVQALEKKLRCSCGCGLDVYTCRTTDFTCTYSPALHKEVVGMLSNGKTPQEVIDAFVAQYGQVALMSPPRRGFNLLGYIVPGVAVLVAASVLFLVLLRWTRQARAAEPVSTPAPPDATPAELERLQRELDKLPG